MQAGAPVLESRRAVSGGATATRAASAGGDALPRRAPCTPDTHHRKHTAAGGRMGALPCYAPSTPLHAHMALTGRHSRIRLYIQERCCPGTATQTRTIACTHLHVYHGAHTHGMQALARTPAAPTLSVAATLAPCCSSVCTTAACPRQEAKCKLVPPSWSAGVPSAAGPQRPERPRQAATLSRAGHPALRTRTSASALQQGVAWAPPRAMHPPRQCMRTRP